MAPSQISATIAPHGTGRGIGKWKGDKKKAVRQWKSFLHCLFELFTGR